MPPVSTAKEPPATECLAYVVAMEWTGLTGLAWVGGWECAHWMLEVEVAVVLVLHQNCQAH